MKLLGTLASPYSTGHWQREFPWVLRTGKSASIKTLWGHVYKWGGHPRGQASIHTLCKETFTRELPLTCYLSIKIVSKSVTEVQNFYWHPHPSTPCDHRTAGKWWAWQMSWSDTTILGAEITSDIFNWACTWESKVQMCPFFLKKKIKNTVTKDHLQMPLIYAWMCVTCLSHFKCLGTQPLVTGPSGKSAGSLS